MVWNSLRCRINTPQCHISKLEKNYQQIACFKGRLLSLQTSEGRKNLWVVALGPIGPNLRVSAKSGKVDFLSNFR